MTTYTPEHGDTWAQRTNPKNVVRIVAVDPDSEVRFLDLIGRSLSRPIAEFVERYEPVIRRERLEEVTARDAS